MRMPDPFDRTSVVTSGFRWTTFDLTGRFPANWQQEIAAVAAAEAEFREFPRTPSLSREASDVHVISRGRLHAGDLRHNLPWLYGFYRGLFLDLAREMARDEPVTTARDDRYGIVLNVQRGTTMRFECHIDSNPLTGLLFCTDHPAGPAANSSSRTTGPRQKSARSTGTARSSGRTRVTSSSSTGATIRTTPGR